MAVQNAKVHDNVIHKPKISATGLHDLQTKLRQTNTDTPLSMHTTTTKTSLKRKADLDSPDAQTESPYHPLGFKTGSSRYVDILLYFSF